MRALLIAVLAFLILPKGGEDPALLGRWRTEVPNGVDHPGFRTEMIFEEKGEFKGNKIIYNHAEGDPNWEPYTAEQFANGSQDIWSTENGFLTLEIRERENGSRDQVLHYEIEGDTLRLWNGEIFTGKNAGLVGKWSYSLFDIPTKGPKLFREIELTEDGKWLDTKEGISDANQYQVKGDQILYITEYVNGRKICPPDTHALNYSLFEKKLFVWRGPKIMELYRKK